jgi:acetyl esterase/lipase
MQSNAFLQDRLLLGGAAILNTVERWRRVPALKRFTNIAYGSHPRQRLDVYRRAGGDKAPIAVFFYGGAWRAGEKAHVAFVGYALAAMGFVVVIADTRLSPEVRFPAFVDDGAAAVRWAHEHADILNGDRNRTILIGHSAGAHTAALLALDQRYLSALSTPISAWVGLAGPYDFFPFPLKLCEQVFAGSRDPLQTQPINFARRDSPPALLIAGTEDAHVPVENTLSLTRVLQDKGATCVSIIEPRATHLSPLLSFSRLRIGSSRADAAIQAFSRALTILPAHNYRR